MGGYIATKEAVQVERQQPDNEYLAERYNGIGIKLPPFGWDVPTDGPFINKSDKDPYKASQDRLIDKSYNYLQAPEQDQKAPIYSENWLSFAAEVSERLGYVTDGTYSDPVIEFGEGRSVSRRLTAFLAMLYDFGFHGDHNKRMPDDPSNLLEGHLESQNTQFHHYLGVALITSKVQGNGLNDDIIVALAHDMFDSQPKLKLTTAEMRVLELADENPVVVEAAHIKNVEHLEIYKQKVNLIWSGAKDNDGQKDVAKKVEESGPEMDFIEQVAELCRPSKHQNLLTREDLVARIRSLQNVIGKVTGETQTHVGKDIYEDDQKDSEDSPDGMELLDGYLDQLNKLDEDEKDLDLTSFAQDLRNNLLAEVASLCSIESIRAMAANLTHNMLFPRRTDNGEIHLSVKRDAQEAIDFYVHLLEIREEQEALRALKDISYRILYEQQYKTLGEAAEALRKNHDPINTAMEALADNFAALKEFMRDQNYNVISQKQFDEALMQYRRDSTTFDDFIKYSETVLSPFLERENGKTYDGVIVLQRPRVKGYGSILAKVLPFEGDEKTDPYHQAILVAHAGENIERYSQKWWEYLIPMLGDPLAARMIFHINPAKRPQEKKKQLAIMKQKVDSFLKKQPTSQTTRLIYRADAKAIGEELLKPVSEPRKKGFLSAVGSWLSGRLDKGILPNLPGVNLHRKRLREITAELKNKDHYKAYHLALAVDINNGWRGSVGVDMHLQEIQDYIKGVYGYGSHLGYKLKKAAKTVIQRLFKVIEV